MIGTDILVGVEAGANDVARDLFWIAVYVALAYATAIVIGGALIWRNWFKKPKPNTSPRVRTIITFDAMQEAHGDVVEVRRVA